MTVAKRFEAQYMPEPMSGCWLWIGAVVDSDYGDLKLGRREDGRISAHRFSYELHHGSIPKGLCVLHRCDTKICVNPDHLFLGTRNDNNQDMIRKGRARTRAKLTKTQVAEIRALLVAGESLRKIGRRFGLSTWPVIQIRDGKTYR